MSARAAVVPAAGAGAIPVASGRTAAGGGGGAPTFRRVLVTGACGYSGSHLVAKLCELGLDVTACDVRAPAAPAPWPATFVQLDVSDRAAVEAVFAKAAGIDTVFHLGALVPFNLGRAYTRDDVMRVNVEGTRNVFTAAKAARVRNFLLASSTGVVFAGEDIANGDESIPFPPAWNDSYSESKALAEQLVLQGSSPDWSAGIAAVAIRPNGIWGPGEQHHIPKLLVDGRVGFSGAVVAPDKLTDFTHRDNLVAAFICAVARLTESPDRRASVNGQAYFVTDGWACHTLEFFAPLLQALGFPSPFPSAFVPFGTVAVLPTPDALEADPTRATLQQARDASKSIVQLKRCCRIGGSPWDRTVAALSRSATARSPSSDDAGAASGASTGSRGPASGSRSSSAAVGAAQPLLEHASREGVKKRRCGANGAQPAVAAAAAASSASSMEVDATATDDGCCPHTVWPGDESWDFTRASDYLEPAGEAACDDAVIITGPPRTPLPGWIMVPSAAFITLCTSVVSCLTRQRLEPFLTQADVRKVVRHNYYNSRRAARELGYAPVRSTASGMRELISYYRSQGYDGRVTPVPLFMWIAVVVGLAITAVLGYDMFGSLAACLKLVLLIAGAGSQGAVAAAFTSFAAWASSALWWARLPAPPPPGAAGLQPDDAVAASSSAFALVVLYIFWAATVCHIGQGIWAFRFAWARRLAAGPWAIQCGILGFASTSKLVAKSGANAQHVPLICISSFVACIPLVVGVHVLLSLAGIA